MAHEPLAVMQLWRGRRSRLLVAAFAAAALALTGTLAITRGFGAWGVTTTNAPSTVTSDVIIVPVVTSTHPNHTAGTVNLSWTEPQTWVQGYNILRATSPTGTYSQIASVSGAGTTTYSDSTAAYNTQYYYEVAPYYFLWAPASAVDMALSLPPTAGSDATGASPAALTSAQLTSLATTGGGGYATASNWSTQHLFANKNAFGVAFPTSSTGWVVGASGVIYQSTDGGENWTAQTSGTASQLNGVGFVGASNGWAAGNAGTILHTTNGGTTWTAETSGSAANLVDIVFPTSTSGWAVGASGTMLNTTNGGSTWLPQVSGSTQQLNGVAFADTSNGWAVGNGGVIVHTSNGGTAWSAQTSGTGQQLNSVAFADISNGWAVGKSGVIVHTSNGGTTWSAQTSGTTQTISGVAFADAANGWAVGAASTILHTTDGGTTWTAQASPTNAALDAVVAIDANHAISAGNAAAAVTSDAGTTWIAPTTQYLGFSFSPTMATGAPITSASATFEYKSGANPGAGTLTYALVMPGNSGAWTVFTLTNPTTSYQTVTVDLTSLITSAAALQGMQVRFEISQSNAFSTTTELVHVDVN